jgi:hypothetical protein
MPQTIELKAKGLYTHPNPLSLPPGAMLKAQNVVIDSDDIVDQRRGFQRYGNSLANMKKLFTYKGRLLAHYGSKIAYDSDGAGTWQDYAGTYNPPAGLPRILSSESNKNFFFLTDAGVMKLDSLAGVIGPAGMFKALDGTAATTGASGWFATNGQVAYRIVWGILDANNNKIIGSPSQRILCANTSGGARNANISFSIPVGITVNHFYQIYRSAATASSTTEPNDELQLIVEKNPTAGEVTAKSITYLDQTPESLRGATLYTCPSQQGILQANEPPPLAKDMVAYKQMMLFVNTTSKHRLNITLISVGASLGIQIGDTITIAGVTYTGAGAENAATGAFLVDTSGTPAANIDSTAKSLIRVINSYASNTSVYAFYLTGFNDLPGKILIEERGIGNIQYSATTSRSTAFSPTVPAAGTTYASSNDVAKNRVFVSKVGQPEAVPLLQYYDMGSANKAILRTVALRDSVFFQKEDGVFRMVGSDPSNLSVSLFDSTTELLNIDSAVAFNNQVFGFTTQGIAGISDSGVSILSRPIETTLLKISAPQYTNFNAASFAIAYESERKFIFATVTNIGDTYSTQQFVYNSLTNTFTQWTIPMNHGLVNDVDNKIYYCNPVLGYVMQERKSFTNMDYADDDILLQITGQNGKIVQVVSTTGVQVGWTLSDGIRSSIITAVNDGTHITVTDLFTWTYAPARAYAPINSAVQWAPIHAGNPALMKHFTDIVVKFRNATFDALTATFSSDSSGYDESYPLLPSFAGLWGYFIWGAPSWGGRDVFLQAIRTLTPREKSRCRWLNFGISHSQALATFSVAGVTFNYLPMSLRSK